MEYYENKDEDTEILNKTKQDQEYDQELDFVVQSDTKTMINRPSALVNIKEWHFAVEGADWKGDISTSYIDNLSKDNETKDIEDEGKETEDEVVNEDFDNALDESKNGMDDRPERVSNLVQNLTPDDFEMIRYVN